MRTNRPPLSSMSDSRATALSSGPAAADLVEEAPVDLEDDLEVPRQHRPNSSIGHFSSASGSSVWFVYAQVVPRHVPRRVPVQLVLVHQQPHQLGDGDGRDACRSAEPPTSHGTCSSGRSISRCSRIMSCSEQLTKKNCCCSRSALPWTTSSFGYSTFVMFSDCTLSSTAR